MRSSNKSRSRNKNSNNNAHNNRRGNTANVVNRVFDSSGPDGRVRGTPQQIIEKYQSLARDAQLAGDRIGSENFSQHAEHYSRLLGEAQREINERREAAEAQQRKDNPQQNNQQQAQPNQNAPQHNAPQHNAVQKSAPQPQNVQHRDAAPQHGNDPQPEIKTPTGAEIFPGQDDDSHMVQTPENAERKPAKPRQRKPSAPKSEEPVQADAVADQPVPKRRKPAVRKPAKANAPVAGDTKSVAAVDPVVVAVPAADESTST